jgi:cytochrome P450
MPDVEESLATLSRSSEPAGSDEAVAYPGPRTLLDPPPELAEYRAECPVRRMRLPSGELGWLVTSYDLGREVLGYRGTRIDFGPLVPGVNEYAERVARFVDEAGPAGGGESSSAPEEGEILGVLALNGEEHLARRRILAGRFSPQAVATLREPLEQIVDDLLDDLGPGSADLVARLAVPYARKALCLLLGIDDDERLTNGLYEGYHPNDPDDGEAFIRSHLAQQRAIAEAFPEAVRRARDEPNDGLLSHLWRLGSLSEREIQSIADEVLAGQHTTVGSIGLSIAILLHGHRRWWQRMVADPEGAVTPIVEELIRHVTVFQHGANFRRAAEDLQVGDVCVRAGEPITVSLSAVNRDPRLVERPDEFDPDRGAGPHVSFGFGVHQCLGQHFVRVELQTLLRRLATRFPDLRLAVPFEELPMVDSEVSYMHGIEALPVTWETGSDGGSR